MNAMKLKSLLVDAIDFPLSFSAYLPVLPNPPTPLTVSESDSTSTTDGV